MERELIRSWLQLPPGDWPPDHYTLLGLAPGEDDGARIEQQVHERMQRLRSYQLTHPELATDAMNCLAQALVCLSDPDAKQVYDRELHSRQSTVGSTSQSPIPVESSGPASVAPSDGPGESRNGAWQETAGPSTEEPRFFDWQTAPPPQRQPQNAQWPTSLEFMNKETVENFALPGVGAADTAPDVLSIPSPDSGATPDGDEIAAKFSRRGLRSKGTLYFQIARTRQLLWAWEQAGKYLSRPTRLVNRPAEATDLIHHMGVIRELLPSATPHMGEAGHPGYLVLTLARQQMIVPTLQTLLPSQREALARDWLAGHALLRNVRQFLRQQLRIVRSRRGWRHALRLLGASFREHPGVLLVLVAWIAVNLASPLILARWPEQLICLGALAAIKLAFWLYSLQPLRFASSPRSKRRPPRERGGQRQPNSSRA